MKWMRELPTTDVEFLIHIKQYCCLRLSLIFCLKFGENNYIDKIKKATYRGKNGLSENHTGLVDHFSVFSVNSCIFASSLKLKEGS